MPTDSCVCRSRRAGLQSASTGTAFTCALPRLGPVGELRTAQLSPTRPHESHEVHSDGSRAWLTWCALVLRRMPRKLTFSRKKSTCGVPAGSKPTGKTSGAASASSGGKRARQLRSQSQPRCGSPWTWLRPAPLQSKGLPPLESDGHGPRSWARCHDRCHRHQRLRRPRRLLNRGTLILCVHVRHAWTCIEPLTGPHYLTLTAATLHWPRVSTVPGPCAHTYRVPTGA